MKIAVIGAGAMGGALVEGFVRGGIDPADVTIVEPHASRAAAFADEWGVTAVSIEEAWSREIVLVAVKPHQIEEVLAGADCAADTVVVSVAAGVTIAQVEAALPDGVAAMRIMPNTGSRLGAGMTGVVRGTHVSDEQAAAVEELLGRVGKTLVVPESKLDALIALSGSGPAYLFYVADAMIEAGVHQGLTRDEARILVHQTFVGASAQLAEGNRCASELREAVTSPAGTTAAALRTLDDHAVRAAFLAAVESCRDRAIEMASGSR